MKYIEKHPFLMIVVGTLLAIFSTILGHSIFSWCLKYFSPAFVSASKLCEPVVAAILAVLLFGEIPAPPQICGGILNIGRRHRLFQNGGEGSSTGFADGLKTLSKNIPQRSA